MFIERYRSGLSCWYAEAVCQGVAIGFCEVLIIIWYTRLFSDPVELGVMLTLPAAVGAISQALLTRIPKNVLGTQAIAVLSVMTQILGLLVMVAALHLQENQSVLLFLGQCFYWIGSMTAASPTQELLAKAVAVERHNQFFSRRALVITLMTLLCNFVSAKFSENDLSTVVLSGFLLFAAFARMLSVLAIMQPRLPTLEASQFQEVVDTKSNSLVPILKLSLCICLFRMAVNFSSPFFSAYILNSLQVTLGVYALLTAVPLFVKMLCLSNWAKLLDDNKKFEGLVLATIGIGIGPIFTGIFQNNGALVGFQVLSGISWSGFDLISVLLVQHMYPRSITNKLGLFLAFGSLGSVLGGVLGGLFFKAYGSYLSLFVVSGVLRLLTGFILLWYLRRHHLFRFHDLNLKHGLAALVTVRPSLEAAAKLIPLPLRRGGS